MDNTYIIIWIRKRFVCIGDIFIIESDCGTSSYSRSAFTVYGFAEWSNALSVIREVESTSEEHKTAFELTDQTQYKWLSKSHSVFKTQFQYQLLPIQNNHPFYYIPIALWLYLYTHLILFFSCSFKGISCLLYAFSH